MISIVGGTKKRTKIQVPPNNVRPTSSIKRESILVDLLIKYLPAKIYISEILRYITGTKQKH